MKKRYLLFSGDEYYPSGGWEDFQGYFESLEDALKASKNDWWQVVDDETGRIVRQG